MFNMNAASMKMVMGDEATGHEHGALVFLNGTEETEEAIALLESLEEQWRGLPQEDCCEDWAEHVVANTHSVFPEYTGPAFQYCPFCGTKRAVEGEEKAEE